MFSVTQVVWVSSLNPEDKDAKGGEQNPKKKQKKQLF
jgi:hypothetical protein